jgi:tRNA threonylcarbamoyladenosine biosynthesis protein TsaE
MIKYHNDEKDAMKHTFISISQSQTYELGALLAPFVSAGAVIALSGDLGAGKTTFTGGLAHGLEIKEHVISPTFNIMREYRKGRIPLFHIDAYRLEDGNADIGLEEFVDDGGVSVIEWPQYVKQLIPQHALHITISDIGPSSRRLEFETSDNRYFDYFELLERMA